MNAMIRKTEYERLFDLLAADPRIADAGPYDGKRGVDVTFALAPGQPAAWHYTGTARPLPDGRYLWTAGMHDIAAGDMAGKPPATLKPLVLDKLDALHLNEAISTAIGKEPA